jgi:hypothetical protein
VPLNLVKSFCTGSRPRGSAGVQPGPACDPAVTWDTLRTCTQRVIVQGEKDRRPPNLTFQQIGCRILITKATIQCIRRIKFFWENKNTICQHSLIGYTLLYSFIVEQIAKLLTPLIRMIDSRNYSATQEVLRGTICNISPHRCCHNV